MMSQPRNDLRRQAGGGMLTLVAVIGVILVLAQGTMYYKSKGSARFLGSEKNKVLAQQLAEAGIEENIADLGKRTIRIRSGIMDSVTYSGKELGKGTYTTRLTTVSTGPASDTIDLLSTGKVGTNTQSVAARMKVRKVLDTTRTPLVIVTPFDSVWTMDTTITLTQTKTVEFDPEAIPTMDKTQAYKDCINQGSGKCKVCHYPGGNPGNVHTVSISVNAVKTHVDHHGDYVAAQSDVDCDLYKPHTVTTTTTQTQHLEKHTLVNHTTYDTTVTIDTSVKVQILSWR
jgi:hypothetical protein